MLFNSFAFAVFLPIVLALYWVLPFRLQNYMLLAASYFFYGYWDWRFLSLIAISTIVDYISGLKIQEHRLAAGEHAQKLMKRWLVLSMCTNLGILGFFKYFNFFVDSFAGALSGIGINPDPLYLNIILPVGISFYTFQTMSYTIDIYRGQMEPTRKFFDFALYVSFFPQLVAGPIERARVLLPQVLQKRSFSRDQFAEGLHLIVLGFFKKVFVADNLAPYVDQVFLNPNPTWFEILFGGWAFAFQVYGDFSGYSDIARGCAKCMGFELMVNFNHPYVATNPRERWQRWHISLSSWLRDYLYIPLGGSRGGPARTQFNLFLTMLLGGLWHGAGWNFVLWGAWEGILLVGHRALEPLVSKTKDITSFIPRWFKKAFWIFVFFNLVSYGLIIFRGQSLANIGDLWWRVLTLEGTAELNLLMPLVYYLLPLILVEAGQYMASRDQWARLRQIPVPVRAVAYTVMVYLFTVHGAAAQSFIYFQF